MSLTRTAPKNPIPPLARVIAAIEPIHLDDGTERSRRRTSNSPSIDTPTHVSNVIPGSATAQLNIRYNNLQKGADLPHGRRDRGSPSARREGARAVFPATRSTPPGPLYDTVSDRRGNGAKARAVHNGGDVGCPLPVKLCPVVEFGLPTQRCTSSARRAVDDIEALSRIYERVVRKVFGYT